VSIPAPAIQAQSDCLPIDHQSINQSISSVKFSSLLEFSIDQAKKDKKD
jgi:hypothetical protein